MTRQSQFRTKRKARQRETSSTHKFDNPTSPFLLLSEGTGLPFALDLVNIEKRPPPVAEEATDEAEDMLALDELEGEVTLADFSSVSMYPPPEKRGFAPSGSIGQGFVSSGLCSRARRSPSPMQALSSVSSDRSAGSSRRIPP